MRLLYSFIKKKNPSSKSGVGEGLMVRPMDVPTLCYCEDTMPEETEDAYISTVNMDLFSFLQQKKRLT